MIVDIVMVIVGDDEGKGGREGRESGIGISEGPGLQTYSVRFREGVGVARDSIIYQRESIVG